MESNQIIRDEFRNFLINFEIQNEYQTGRILHLENENGDLQLKLSILKDAVTSRNKIIENLEYELNIFKGSCKANDIYIRKLQKEINTHKKNSDTLRLVVEAMRPYFSNDVGSASTVSRIANILEKYFDTPEQSIDEECVDEECVECCKMVDIAANLQQELEECHDQNKVLSKFFNSGIIWRNESIVKLHSEIDRLEDELSTRNGNTEVLRKVVKIVNSETRSYKSIDELADLLIDYIDAPEQPEDEDSVLVGQIAKILHEMFTSTIQKRQMNGSIPSGATDIVMYNKLTDSSKEYLYEQADEILKLIK